jgi:hypothetical protein
MNPCDPMCPSSPMNPAYQAATWDYGPAPSGGGPPPAEMVLVLAAFLIICLAWVVGDLWIHRRKR